MKVIIYNFTNIMYDISTHYKNLKIVHYNMSDLCATFFIIYIYIIHINIIYGTHFIFIYFNIFLKTFNQYWNMRNNTNAI